MKRRVLLPLLLVLLSGSIAGDLRAGEGELHTIRTDDGVALRALRLRADGPPILLCHGYGSNAQQFLLSRRSFARFLQSRGYDVWCLNFRGIGQGPLASEGPRDHSFDDLVALDLPAAVRAVRAATGQRPFLMGHSMGGMVSLAWVQGAERAQLHAAGGLRMRGRPSLAARRAGAVRGVVAIGSPSRFSWPGSGRCPLAFERWDRNPLLTVLTREPTFSLANELLTRIRPERASKHASRLLALPGARPLRQALARGRSPILRQLMAPGSIDSRVLDQGLALAIGPAPARVRLQFVDGIRHEDMRELRTADPGRAPYSYADGHRRIVAPVLWVAGSRDLLANDEAIEATLETLESRDRTLLRTDHGHVDLVLGDDAPQRVWAPIAAWLDARSRGRW